MKQTKRSYDGSRNQRTKYAIENGVKETNPTNFAAVDEAIQNGVKSTHRRIIDVTTNVEDTIENGVKNTLGTVYRIQSALEDTIENGVKDTKLGAPNNRDYFIEDTIENGVKLTNGSLQIDGSCVIEEVIQEGVKETQMMGNDREIIVAENIYDEKKNTIIHKTTVFDIVEDTIQNGVKQTSHSEDEDLDDVEDTIQNGVKETRLLFERYHVDVEDTIQNGVKETRNNRLPRTVHVMNTIINGVKVSKPMDEWVNTERIVGEVVKDGVKEIKTPGEDGDLLGFLDFMLNNNTDSVPQLIDDVIVNGVKETQPLPAQDGNMDWGNYYHGKEDRTKPFNEYLDDAIRFGVKEVIDEKHHRTREVVLTIKDGVKETYDDCSDNIARVEGIIRVGKKLDKDGI